MKVNRIAFLMAALFLSVGASLALGQAGAKPTFAGYKGVMVGMPMSEARTKLGDARDKSDSEDYYVYGDNETVQVLWGPDKTVRVISINYIGKNAPTPMDVLGTEVAVKPDGSMNKRVEFPKAGYWISYLRTAGDDPITVVTVQKMPRVDQ